MSENTTNQEENKNTDIVEVEWEEIKPIIELRNELLRVDQALAALLLEAEKKKAKLLVLSEQLDADLQTASQQLRDSKGIDPSVPHELKVPNDFGDKGYFIKK
jgi:hypothetical protein